MPGQPRGMTVAKMEPHPGNPGVKTLWDNLERIWVSAALSVLTSNRWIWNNHFMVCVRAALLSVGWCAIETARWMDAVCVRRASHTTGTQTSAYFHIDSPVEHSSAPWHVKAPRNMARKSPSIKPRSWTRSDLLCMSVLDTAELFQI